MLFLSFLKNILLWRCSPSYLIANKLSKSDYKLSLLQTNITPTLTGTEYKVSDDVLKNCKFVCAYFSNSDIGAVFVPYNTYSFGNNVLTGAEVRVDYHANEGEVVFLVRRVGSSQSIENYKLFFIAYM